MAQELTAPQSAEIMHVDHSTVFRWVADGHLPARREGLKRTIYIDLDDLRLFARENGYPFDERAASNVQ